MLTTNASGVNSCYGHQISSISDYYVLPAATNPIADMDSSHFPEKFELYNRHCNDSYDILDMEYECG